MFGQQEKLSSPQEEIAHIASETHKAYILQEQEHKTLESAAHATIDAYAKAEAKDFLHETQVLPAHETERIVLKLKPEAHDQKIEELFGLMLEKGIKNTLDVVAKMNDPHLEDDFHRFLVQYLHTIGAIPGLPERSALRSELEHTLFTISLPGTPKDQGEREEFKKFIQAMKQFYVGMTALTEGGRHYTLELATQNKGKNIAIYASVPRDHIDIFEKLVHAYYPGAAVEEAIDDYNIFSASGSGIVAAVAELKEAPTFPIQTDNAFENDPLLALISSLSKLEEDGEGAAIQLVVAEDKEKHNVIFQNVLKAAEKDLRPVKDIYKDQTRSILSEVGVGVLSLFGGDKKKDDDAQADAKGIELLKQKNASPVLMGAIRIIAAAKNLDRAKTILTTIKSTFRQFELVGSNAIEWKDIRPSGIHDMAHTFSFRTLEEKQLIPLSVDELATLFHLPVGLEVAPEFKEAKSSTAPAATTQGNPGSVYLGENDYRGTSTPVYLSKEDRVRHCYVIGQTGTGKTTILKNMIIQDIKNGHGVCFMDPHGTDLEDILANIPPERIDDVIYFDPAYTARPMGLNMLEYDPNFPEQKIFVINELLAIFNKLFDMKVAGGPMFEQYFRNSAGLVMEHPESGSTLLEIGRVLTDKPFRDMKLAHCKNPIIKQFWENAEKTTGESALANFVPYITNKFDVFVSNDIMRPVIAQEKSVLNFREIMDKKKILLVNLSKGRLGDINSHLIGLLLVGKLTMAALSRVDMVGRGEINDFYLYIDEFQNVTTDSIATILSEARKYRLSLTVAHQYIEQLEENIKNAIFGNVGSMIIYRVSPENAQVFEKQLEPTFKPSDLLTLQNFNAIAKILVSGTPEKPFNLRIPPPPKGNFTVSDKVKELSYLKYGRPREEVESEIMARYQK